MIIQHNIAALNAHRQLGGNNNIVAKNLEKLSSGYRINKAGDDAAGLAISEKMRAQIKGLERASANAQDGISLIQTAEGALTEVHSMLNRMVELSTQSANGTYKDEVDRDALQSEVNSLRSEIDRVAQSTNFNGINLLDGSLSDGTKASVVNSVKFNMPTASAGAITDVDAIAGKYTMSAAVGALTANDANVGDKVSLKVDYTDADGKAQTKNIEFTVAKEEGKATFMLVSNTGSKYNQGTVAAADAFDATAVGAAALQELQKDSAIANEFKMTNTAGVIDFEATDKGTTGAKINDFNLSKYTAATLTTAETAIAVTESTKAEDAYEALDLSKIGTFDTSKPDTTTFEINGKKFAIVADTATLDDSMLKALKDAGVDNYMKASAGTLVAVDATNFENMVKLATGLRADSGVVAAGKFTAGDTETDLTIAIRPTTSEVDKAGAGLKLQIGDTADDFNAVTVSVEDMSSKGLGVNVIDISNMEDAAKAQDIIKTAINKVSTNRANMGALQNRLEHTVNNLGVTTENMTAAESRVRDVDMAKEMMAFTKNNVLTQVAQAMLAQANQQSQGVLQLLR